MNVIRISEAVNVFPRRYFTEVLGSLVYTREEFRPTPCRQNDWLSKNMIPHTG